MKTSNCHFRQIASTFVLLLAACLCELDAQPGSLDTHFNAAVTIGQVGYSLAVQPDGKVIASGDFGLLRLRGDGSVDSTFNPPFPQGQAIGATVIQPDGKIFILGSVTNSAGTLLPGIVRLNSDGSIDSSFNLDVNAQPIGRSLLLQSDGKVVSAGVYYDPIHEEYGGLLRLRSDGSLDPAFDSRGVSASDPLALAPDGKIYFVSDVIARANPDGSPDGTFAALGPGAPATLVVQPDGKLLVGEYVEAFHMRRLLPEGAEDPEWIRPEISGGDAVIQAILFQPDGKILVGGNNVFDATIGRLHPDGSRDTSFDSRGDLYSYTVNDMALAPDGKIIVAGYRLDRPYITAAPGIWRLENDSVLQPQLTIRLTVNEGITVGLRGQPGVTYRLEYRERMTHAGSWIPLTNLTLSGSSSATWQDVGWTSSASRYYRAVSVP
jgi:uncharacterized delta-60 repeat protein